MALEAKKLHEAFVEELKDLYSAESMLVDALPKMEKAASNDQLKQGFNKHHSETKKQRDRLDKIFDRIGTSPGNKTCHGMEGILKEGEMIMQKNMDNNVKDAALIAAAQKVEHYEIAMYGTMATWADFMGEDEIASMLKETLEEEKRTDQKLTEMAEKQINKQAVR
jgi:ferritin-like metal-binding protein YciE